MLPKLNDQPKYDFVIPSTGKKVRFRPYLVREEKVLLTAFATNDKVEGIKAMVETLSACAAGDFDPKDLTIFDLTYLFSKVRAKSVGENIKLNIPCVSCETKNLAVIDIDNIDVEGKQERKKTIKLTDTVSVELKYPNYQTIINNPVLLSDSTSDGDRSVQLVKECIIAVLTEDERIVMDEQSEEEKIEFVESMSTSQFNEIKEFVDNEPKLKFDINFVCKSCGEENKYNIGNIEDFF